MKKLMRAGSAPLDREEAPGAVVEQVVGGALRESPTPWSAWVMLSGR